MVPETAEEFRLLNIFWVAMTILFIIVTSIALGFIARFVARLRGATDEVQRKTFVGFTFAGPWIVGFLIFVLGPALVSFYYSFTNFQLGGGEVQFIGLENYRTLLIGQSTQGRQFSQAMFNSFYYAILGVPLQILAALGMAMLLNRALPGMRVFRTIFYLPVILAGGPAILVCWRFILLGRTAFLNVMLLEAAKFPPFGWLYRTFIFLSEGFNGFYMGLVRGNPVGPLTYTLPALIGLIALLTLAFGDWSDSKRSRAWRAAELIALVIIYSLAFKGLVADPIDPTWTYFAGILAGVFIMLNARNEKTGNMRLWQFGAITLFVTGAVLTLVASNFQFTNDAVAYLIPAGLGVIPAILSLFGEWNTRKYQVIGGVVVLLAVIIFVRIIPAEFNTVDRLLTIPRYLTFGSTLTSTTDQNYLEKVYPQETLSPLWIWGLAAVVMVAAALINNRNERVRRYMLYGAFAVFALITISSLLDGIRYFQAFAEIGAASGKPVYHFKPFRDAVDSFPNANVIPGWMTHELWTKPALLLITMWSSGTGMLIFLAALKGVPKSLYEAAQVDGANKVQQFFSITLPMISPAMFYNIVVGIIAALQTFENIYILQTPTTVDQLRSAAFFLWQRTFTQLAIGEGAAVSWILAAIILTVTVLQFRYSNWVYYEV